MNEELKNALLVLKKICESNKECFMCPLYDESEDVTACMLVSPNDYSLEESIDNLLMGLN